MRRSRAERELFERFLAEERLRSARHVAGMRLGSALGIGILGLGFGAAHPGFIGPPPWLAVYVALAAIIFALRLRYAAGVHLDGLLIAVLDLPMIFGLFLDTIWKLQSIGAYDDAAKLPYAAFVFFALVVLFASLSLARTQLLLTAAVALVLQSALVLLHENGEYYLVGQGAISIGVALALGLYSRSSTMRLMSGFAQEQLRKERLGRYFSPQIAAWLGRDGDDLRAGRTMEVTLLFADLRDFTAMSERMASTDVVALLSDFHTRMVECLFAHGATLDKYMGDGLMAYFGAPVEQPDHPVQAVRCAMAMQASLEVLNDERRRGGLAPLRMGIGIHTGPAVLGDIGAPQRREFTAIGDTVNVAARIEQLTKTCNVPILVSEQTRDRVGQGFEFDPVEPVMVKGKSEPLRTFLPRPREHAARGVTETIAGAAA